MTARLEFQPRGRKSSLHSALDVPCPEAQYPNATSISHIPDNTALFVFARR